MGGPKTCSLVIEKRLVASTGDSFGVKSTLFGQKSNQLPKNVFSVSAIALSDARAIEIYALLSILSIKIKAS